VVWFYVVFKPSRILEQNKTCILCNNCERDRDKFHLTKTHICCVLNEHIDPAQKPTCNNKFELISFLERVSFFIWGR
jgi:hypothetical protein